MVQDAKKSKGFHTACLYTKQKGGHDAKELHSTLGSDALDFSFLFKLNLPTGRPFLT